MSAWDDASERRERREARSAMRMLTWVVVSDFAIIAALVLVFGWQVAVVYVLACVVVSFGWALVENGRK